MPRGNRKSKIADNIASVGNDGNSGADEQGNVRTDSGDDNNTVRSAIDPATVVVNDDNHNDGQPRKRGWPKGRPRGSRTSAENRPSDLAGIEKLLFGLHMALSHVVAPELAMARDDCRELSQAWSDVNRHYNFALLDQKSADWFNLLQLVAVAYGTRVIAIRDRRRRDARPTSQPRAQTGNPAPLTPDEIARSTGFNGAGERAARTGEIAGLGSIEFPPGHPLSSKH